eukprot:scaffold18799_cov38-Tisochrysis_lutea.AAC.2
MTLASQGTSFAVGTATGGDCEKRERRVGSWRANEHNLASTLANDVSGPSGPLDSYASGPGSQGAQTACSNATDLRFPNVQRIKGHASSGIASMARKPNSRKVKISYTKGGAFSQY